MISFKSNPLTASLRLPVFLFICLIPGLQACKKKEAILPVDPAYARYVQAYTSGVVSKASTIRIVLAENVQTTHKTGEILRDNLVSISPAVEGKATWTDARTIEFKPAKTLTPATLYTVTFKLGKIIQVPEKFREMRFTFQTITPAFTVRENGLRSDGTKEHMYLEGTVQTADVENSPEVEKLLSAQYEKGKYKITWQHTGSTKKHDFKIESINRTALECPLRLIWNGKALGIKNTGEKIIQVPALGVFKVLQMVAINNEQQYASIQFSDPIAVGQELIGLVSFSKQENPAYSINGSEVKLFGSEPLDGNYSIGVYPGIKNSWGQILEGNYAANIVFDNLMPGVNILGKGNILPHSGKLLLPFEAVNLSAVDVSIVKIYENNIPQFLQDNNLDGNNDLRRVALPVVQQTLRLDDDKSLDLHQKQHFTLDIDKYLETEPGAIYHITIGFRPGYNLYLQDKKGSGVNNARADEEENADEEDDEESTAAQKIYEEDNSLDNFWERYDNYYPYGYSWKKRNDPSHPSYYNKERWATRNIIASNLGLTAKVGNDKTLHVMVTDILTTKAMRGVDFQVMNFQEQVIGKGSSDGDGAAEISLSGEPFLLLAKDGKETGYLKLDDGSALPLDRFDVSGEKIKNGIKGFLFGERGVWRPGDSLFLTCMVESDKGKLPDDFPLEFTLVTPQGQLYQQESMQGIDGFYTWKTATTPEAPTGNWLLKAKIGGASFEKRLKIETVMPNRLKIKLNFPDNELLSPGGTAGSLEALWLFGTPGKNLHAKIDASLYARKTSFPAFAGYSFDNPSRDYQTQSATMFDGNLDEAGKAVIKANFEAGKEAPGMLTANLVTKVFEPGGSFSIDYFSIPYSPYESYAGLKLPEGEKPFNYLLAGRPHSVSLVNTDSHGKLLSGTREVEILYYRVEWRWWWEEGGNNLGNFTQDEYNKLLKKETISLVNGRGSWTFNSGPDDWGRYYIQIKDLKSGHSAGEVFYIDGPGWQSRSGNEDQTAASMLTFSSDKVKYSVGDKVTLSIPSSSGGRVLVSLEDGSRVLNTFWQETTQGQTKVSFTAGKDMAPNIYATVSLLQPHAQTINDLPIRMFGAIPIPVEDKETILNPVLKVPATIRPEEQLSLTVSEQHGKEMTYCIAVVDEGLLDLTRFKTPEPHSAFYAREALGVKSFDVYDYVIGAWGNELERILTIGGDADAGPPKPKQANRFKPVVKFLGPFHIGKNEQYTATFKMPAYVGAVRAMVIAGHSGSYGSAEKSVTVKKPLMVLATLPRVLAPGEQIRVPLTVFAMDNAIKDVEVKITTNPLLGITAGNTQTLHFANTGDKLAYADVTVNNFTGIGKLKVTVSSGRETATDEVELQVRNPNPVISQVSQSTLTGGNKWQNTFTPIGNDENSRVTLEVSSIPQMNLQKRITYLVYYPHGCIEQTTSAVFPQLFLNQLSDLDEKQKAEVERNIKAGIEKIAHFQLPSGGFSYWPGMREPDDWGSSYAGHFLTEARNYGYTVSDYMVGQWKTFQRQAANAWAPSSTNFYGGDLAQAYRLYTLALAKAPELGAMNRLKEFKYISAEARWRLAAAYQLAGLSNAAQDLVSGLPLQFPERNFWGFTYGSDTRDEAMVLETLTLMGNRNKGQEVLVGLAAKMNSENWYSTQTTAYTLLAIAKYCGKNPAGQKINAQLMINGSPVTINSSSYIQQVPIFFKAGTNTLELVNKNPNQLFVKLVVQGRPLTGEAVPVINNSGLLAMKISYLTRDGKALNENNLNQGSDFMAKVSVKNTGNMNYTQMALSQVFPSGWEILNARMMDGEGSFTSSPFTYRDVRDDRVYTYFDIEEKKEKIYYVQLNATYPGKYFMPANACSAMYDNRISASTGGKWVVVTNNR